MAQYKKWLNTVEGRIMTDYFVSINCSPLKCLSQQHESCELALSLFTSQFSPILHSDNMSLQCALCLICLLFDLICVLLFNLCFLISNSPFVQISLVVLIQYGSENLLLI